MKQTLILILLLFAGTNIVSANSSWNIVGDGAFGEQVQGPISIDFNPVSNEPYVSYWQYYLNESLVKKYDGNSWVGVGGDFGYDCFFSSFDFSTAGIPYLSTTCSSILYFQNNIWNSVPDSSDKGDKIVIDNNNNLYSLNTIIESGNNRLIVNKFDGNDWSVVGSGDIALKDPTNIPTANIFIDNLNQLYIAYMYTDGLYAIKFDGANWVDVGSHIVSTSDNLYPDSFDLTFDSSNKPYIAFDESDDIIHVKSFNGTIWQGVLGENVGAGNDPCITYNNNDSKIYVAYGKNVKKMGDTSWVSIGDSSSIPNDIKDINISPENNSPYIAIEDDSNLKVKVMKYEESNPVYRFWSDQNQGHFYTSSEEEKNMVINNYDDYIWRYEGVAFNSLISGKPVYRFWSDKNQHHFYTANEEEKNMVINNYDDYIWRYEGIAYYLPEISAKPIYRFWSDQNQSHFYTDSEEERNNVINNYDDYIWRYEGVAFYAY
jgi:hypothetical protein